MRAAVIFPAEVIALFALWEHLYDFDLVIPRTFVWIAWSLLVVGIFVAGWLIAFAISHDALPTLGAVNRTKICDDLLSRVQVLNRGIRLSVVVSLVALGITAVAYAIDKAT